MKIECGATDYGGNVEDKHTYTKQHYCMLKPRHKGNHLCTCGWSWKRMFQRMFES